MYSDINHALWRMYQNNKISQQQLIQVARLLDAGELKTFVDTTVPLEEAAAAYARAIPERRGYGKVVVTVGNF